MIQYSALLKNNGKQNSYFEKWLPCEDQVLLSEYNQLLLISLWSVNNERNIENIYTFHTQYTYCSSNNIHTKMI